MSARAFAGHVDAGAPTILDEAESHYLRRVRRLADGATLELIDAAGDLWSATLVGGDARRSELQVHARLSVAAPARELVLLLGTPDPAAALELLPGVVELGVTSVAWVRCARSQSGPPGDARVDRVVRAAQRQCGRPRPPAFLGPMPLAAALEHRTDLRGYFAWEARRGAAPDQPVPAGARLCVGPEGGFTDDEADALTRAGFVPLGLGPFTLRTPTAALVGLARLLFAPAEP